MMDLNPYFYNTVDYFKKEMELAYHKLDLVIIGAVKTIGTGELQEEEVISACEAVVLANEDFEKAHKRYEEAIAREENKNE